MKNYVPTIRSIIKRIWSFFVGISNIISCGIAILTCYITYTAAKEIINLNIEIAPITEKIQKDSIVVIRESPTPKPDQDSHFIKSPAVSPQQIDQSTEVEESPYLSSSAIDKIQDDRDKFFERMQRIRQILNR